jgi:hypothetical protein
VETEFCFKWSGNRILFWVEWKQNFVLSGVETEFHFGVSQMESFGVSETESFGVLEMESFGVSESEQFWCLRNGIPFWCDEETDVLFPGDFLCVHTHVPWLERKQDL